MWQRSAGGWAHQIVEEAYALHERPGSFRGITEQPLKVIRGVAKELADELDEVLERWVRCRRHPEHEGDRTTYLFFSILQPHPERTGG